MPSWPAVAESRPTEGGLWSFDAADEVQTWDEPGGAVRVHYSVSGPNVAFPTDADDDGVPDYVELVGETTAGALAFYTDTLQLRPPLPETAIGPELGGSAALDVYLVDFGGSADGRVALDGCDAATGHCAGFLVIENDFVGYSYPTLEDAVSTVASHELFHAVQAAYVELPSWLSEGTATWAQRQFDPQNRDFERLCNGYLADPTRPLYQPPPGPVPSFAYGAALWFDFASRRHDPALTVEMLEILEASDDLPEFALQDALLARDDDLAEAWPAFARANLATGFRSGAATTHPYAGNLDAIEAHREGVVLDLDARIFPLSANYWRIDHPGGVLHAGADAALPDVAFSLHPIAEFAADGIVGDPIDTWAHDDPGVIALWGGDELPPGGYWIVAAHRAIAPSSAKAHLCIGDPATVEACDVGSIEPGDTDGNEPGDTDGNGTFGEPIGSTGDDGPEGESTDEGIDQTDPGAGGCGCGSASPQPSAPWWLVAFGLVVRRRRDGRPH